jgi:hypothetical protein
MAVVAFTAFDRDVQTAERFTLSGNAVSVYNVAGAVRVERGPGTAVVVEVSRGGADAARLQVVERTIDGRSALCVVYPDERIIYRPAGENFRWGSSSSNSTSYSCAADGSRSRRITVASRGDGVEAWADLRILVPQGRDVRVDHMVGLVEVRDVDATLSLDVASARVSSLGTAGKLDVDAGSGGVTVERHRGDLSIDVGSGAISVADVDATSVGLDTGSGSVTGRAVRADELLIDTGSGGVELTGTTARRTRVESGSGTVRVELLAPVETLDIETGSGGVTVRFPQAINASLSVSTGSGGINTDFPVRVDRATRNSLRGTIGNGGGSVRIETGSGGVRLMRSGQ